MPTGVQTYYPKGSTMGGYFVSKRSIPLGASVTYQNGVETYRVDPGLTAGFTPQTQVTTSYRTGRAAEQGVSLEELEDNVLLDGTSTYKDRFQIFRGQYLRDHASSNFDTGHTFSTEIKTLRSSHESVALSSVSGGSGNRYDGLVYSDPSYHATPGQTWIAVPSFNVNEYGPRAISVTRPTHPAADLAIALAELKREGIPSLPHLSRVEGKVKTARTMGGNYLNYEFGWKPLVSEMQSAFNAVRNAGRILEQYQRDSGKQIRRKFTFPPQVLLNESLQGSGRIRLASNTGISFLQSLLEGGVFTGSRLENRKIEREIWFSGAYTYYLQRDGTILDKLKRYEQQVNRLLGLRITPEVLWNLAPWSWLADWNVNIGHNIGNATALASDGLVLRYAYLMVKTTTTHTVVINGPAPKGGTSGSWTTTFQLVRKERFRAPPFGFGSNPATYTDRQWAILGALGMTKAPKTLP